MGQSTHAPLPRSLPWLAGKCPLAARASRRQTRRGGPQGADRQAEALPPGDRPKKPYQRDEIVLDHRPLSVYLQGRVPDCARRRSSGEATRTREECVRHLTQR